MKYYREDINNREDAILTGCTYLTVIDCEIKMVQRVVRGTVDDVLERVASEHFGIMNL